MKIDFDSSYPQIVKLLDEPSSLRSTASRDGAAFAKLLGEIAPGGAQAPEATVKGPLTGSSPTGLPEVRDEPMASFKFTAPEPVPLSYEPIKPEIPVTAVEEASDEGVKSPTLLEARRIELPRAFSELRHSERVAEVKKMVEQYGEKHGIDPVLGMAVVAKESSFNSNAVSSDGHASKGLFQLLDSTGKGLLNRSGRMDDYDPFDPDLNVELGVGYLRYLHDIFSQQTVLPNNLRTVSAANSASLEKLAVAAFNAGEGRVAWAQGRAKRDGLDPSRYENVESYLPESTQEYVRKVMRSKIDFERSYIG